MKTKEERKQEFLEKARVVHSGENLDYSEVVYANNRTPVKIIDRDLDENGNEYGPFYPTPSNFLKGQGHPKKRGKRISKSKRAKQDEVIARFKEVHKGENLDYSEVEYVNMHTKVKIISHDLRPDGTEYGEFWQEPIVHLKGCTHPDIGKEKCAAASRYDTEKFIELAKQVHSEDDYDYGEADYTGSQKKVTIICNKIGVNGEPHGPFRTNPDLFLQGKGCPICGNCISKAEDEIYRFLVSKFGPDSVIRRDRSLLGNMEIDIYLPKLKLGIEYNGLRWHSEQFGKGKWYHRKKSDACNEKGVRLIQIFEDEWNQHKNIVIDKISNICELNSDKLKINARDCIVAKEESNTPEIKQFLDTNHIQGYVNATCAYCCRCSDGKLVGVMLFTRKGSEWEMVRFCSDNGYICRGVASKLFKHFINEEKPEYVKSFLDNRWCSSYGDNLYTKLGFTMVGITNPDYMYTNGSGMRMHKFGFRKKILSRKYGFSMDMTESEIVKKLGYYKIWNCGLIKYVWKKKEGAS